MRRSLLKNYEKVKALKSPDKYGSRVSTLLDFAKDGECLPYPLFVATNVKPSRTDKRLHSFRSDPRSNSNDSKESVVS